MDDAKKSKNKPAPTLQKQIKKERDRPEQNTVHQKHVPRECLLPTCEEVFTPTRSWQKFCTPVHYREYWTLVRAAGLSAIADATTSTAR